MMRLRSNVHRLRDFRFTRTRCANLGDCVYLHSLQFLPKLSWSRDEDTPYMGQCSQRHRFHEH